MMRLVPFALLAAACAPVPPWVSDPELALEQARAIGWAVRAASRYLPWSSTCLVQVLAAAPDPVLIILTGSGLKAL